MPALVISCCHVSAVGSQLVQWDSPIIAVNLPSKPLYFRQQIVVLATVYLNTTKPCRDYKAGGREEHETRLTQGLGKFHVHHFSKSDNSPNPKLRVTRVRLLNQTHGREGVTTGLLRRSVSTP